MRAETTGRTGSPSLPTCRRLRVGAPRRPLGHSRHAVQRCAHLGNVVDSVRPRPDTSDGKSEASGLVRPVVERSTTSRPRDGESWRDDPRPGQGARHADGRVPPRHATVPGHPGPSTAPDVCGRHMPQMRGEPATPAAHVTSALASFEQVLRYAVVHRAPFGRSRSPDQSEPHRAW